MSAALTCRRVVRHYPSPEGPIEVLRGVDLEVDTAEVVAVLGPSGSGKSTLLHLLAGLDSPDAGEIYWDDFPVHRHPPQRLAARRARTVGLVFQQHYLLDDISVLDNVTLPGRILGSPDRARGEVLLAEVGLSARRAFVPGKLSGGEKQRVAVARALYLEPSLILADEPTGSLDRESARGVFELLVGMARERGSAVVMVTHDEGLVREVDRRYRLERGRLIPVGHVTEVAR